MWYLSSMSVCVVCCHHQSSIMKNHGRPHGIMLSGQEHSGDAQEWIESVCVLKRYSRFSVFDCVCVCECLRWKNHRKCIPALCFFNMTFCSLSRGTNSWHLCVCYSFFLHSKITSYSLWCVHNLPTIEEQARLRVKWYPATHKTVKLQAVYIL